MSTSIYTDLNPFNFIRKHFLQFCVWKFAVNLQQVFKVLYKSVNTGLNPYRTVA
jgi:hypothetical protein